MTRAEDLDKAVHCKFLMAGDNWQPTDMDKLACGAHLVEARVFNCGVIYGYLTLTNLPDKGGCADYAPRKA